MELIEMLGIIAVVYILTAFAEQELMGRSIVGDVGVFAEVRVRRLYLNVGCR